MRGNNALKQSEVKTSLADFMESYNKSVPVGFPRPSVKLLKTFQELHPMLFKHGDEWSIDKHRKRFMDWLVSHHTAS